MNCRGKWLSSAICRGKRSAGLTVQALCVFQRRLPCFHEMIAVVVRPKITDLEKPQGQRAGPALHVLRSTAFVAAALRRQVAA
jgi:hypothetical protein